jgi:hypothetical protein
MSPSYTHTTEADEICQWMKERQYTRDYTHRIHVDVHIDKRHVSSTLFTFGFFRPVYPIAIALPLRIAGYTLRRQRQRALGVDIDVFIK